MSLSRVGVANETKLSTLFRRRDLHLGPPIRITQPKYNCAPRKSARRFQHRYAGLNPPLIVNDFERPTTEHRRCRESICAAAE